MPGGWQIEIAFFHLKATVRGGRRELRGQSPALARQEAWGRLLIHNLVATAVARAAVQAGTDPKLIPFAAALALIREHVTADACCPHCGKRPARVDDPLALLTTAIAGQPLSRENRKRTSGRTKAERRKWPTEEAAYDITIVPSNLPKADTSPTT